MSAETPFKRVFIHDGKYQIVLREDTSVVLGYAQIWADGWQALSPEDVYRGNYSSSVKAAWTLYHEHRNKPTPPEPTAFTTQQQALLTAAKMLSDTIEDTIPSTTINYAIEDLRRALSTFLNPKSRGYVGNAFTKDKKADQHQ